MSSSMVSGVSLLGLGPIAALVGRLRRAARSESLASISFASLILWVSSQCLTTA
jgi:hypothetical protein